MVQELALRVAQISDTHISKFGQFIPNLFDEAVREVNRLSPQPDTIIHTGDLTDNGVLSDYELAVEKLAGFKPRIHVAPGNHDEKNYGQQLFKEIIGRMDYEVNLGKVVALFLNSPEPDRDEGRLGRRRQDYLEERLKACPPGVLKVVVFHHHLVPVPFSGREVNVLEDAGDILETVLRHQVNLVLMGHRHVRRALRIDRTVLVNAGTVSSVRTRVRLGHSFNVVDIYADGTIKVLEKNLTLGKEFLLAEYKPLPQ